MEVVGEGASGSWRREGLQTRPRNVDETKALFFGRRNEELGPLGLVEVPASLGEASLLVSQKLSFVDVLPFGLLNGLDMGTLLAALLTEVRSALTVEAAGTSRPPILVRSRTTEPISGAS